MAGTHLASGLRVPLRLVLSPLAVVLSLLLVACNGVIGDVAGPDGKTPDSPSDRLPTPRFHFNMEELAKAPGIRMLTNVELSDSIYDLTGIKPDVSPLPEELELYNLDNDASRLSVRDAAHMRWLLEIATDVAVRADTDAVLPCSEDPCADPELRSFLERAFIRKIDDATLASYGDRYRTTRSDKGHLFARQTVLQMALISPFFLYRTEVGDAGGALVATELAAKLSFFLWGTRPDEELLAAAFDRTLLESATYDAQVGRLLADSRAEARILRLIHLWLGTDDFDLVNKTASDELPSGLTEAMYEEVRLLVANVLFEQDLPLKDLFLADHTYLNRDLAEHYGLVGPEGSAFERVDLTGTDRKGILTTGLVLSAHAKEDGRSPIQRGAFLIGELVCHGFPPEAGAAVMALPDAPPDATFRDRFTPLETTSPCSNCHQTLNAGFAFEIFDEMGRLQPPGVVMPEEVAGFFNLPPYERLEFETTGEAIEGFAHHPAMPRCFVAQAYRYAQGRLPGSQDAEALRVLTQGFADGDQNVRALFRQIARSDAFRTAVSR